MKRTMRNTILVATLAAVNAPLPAHADNAVLEGAAGLACQAILCLSSSVVPGECMPSLSYYFDIVKKTMSKTISARLDFLNLCPVASLTSEMQSLVSAISNGAGQCDTASLNQMSYYDSQTGKSYISNRYPGNCSAYYSHSYTDFKASVGLPKFVGLPERGGYWIAEKDYDVALAEYNARVAREDEQARREAQRQW